MTTSLTATITSTPPLTVGALYTPASSTPGNVGLCLSGGGTRACAAGMGQLRALASLQANGASLLSQIKALSTVSGGSWLGVPYQFLPASGPPTRRTWGPTTPTRAR
jgi:predicted acylesterase/phospholipase RssA